MASKSKSIKKSSHPRTTSVSVDGLDEACFALVGVASTLDTLNEFKSKQDHDDDARREGEMYWFLALTIRRALDLISTVPAAKRKSA
jgi:hypothetical protein